MLSFIEQFTNTSIIPSLSDFIRIPNLSPQFDSEWQSNQLLEQACNHIITWITRETQQLNREISTLRIPNAPSAIAVKIKGDIENSITVLCYGHYDKQPHFTGWKVGFGPTEPIVINEHLYGRGSSDDGCVPYAVISAVLALKAQNSNYNECILLVEGEEESGSNHLIEYISMLHLKKIDIIIPIDSGIVDYDRLWITNSMRGAITFDLIVEESENPFSILRMLLNQLENSETGQIHPDFNVSIPPDSYNECRKTAELVSFDFSMKCDKMEKNHTTQYVNRAWQPSISYIGGLEDLTPTSQSLTMRISMRLQEYLQAKMLKSLLNSQKNFQQLKIAKSQSFKLKQDQQLNSLTNS